MILWNADGTDHAGYQTITARNQRESVVSAFYKNIEDSAGVL